MRILEHERRGAPAALARETQAPLFAAGRNCWCIQPAGRVAFFIDGANYFKHLRAALRRARQSIFIVGWDFDPNIRLDPVDAPDESLGALLTRLALERPMLQIRLLIWSFSTFYGPSRTPFVQIEEPWHARAPNITFEWDSAYPLGGSHHEKIVCIDDSIAFIGGIDLTAERWDTPAHGSGDPRRHEWDGTPFRPVHDMQIGVDGAAAQAIAAHVRDRWAVATGRTLAPPQPIPDPWPPEAKPWLSDIDVGIARTRPPYGDNPGIREVEALNVDVLRSAQRAIYIETQYFTARNVGDTLAERLSEPDGPEVVVVVTRESKGWLEQFAMGSNRERLLRRLKAEDRWDRLRVYYPVVPSDDGEQAVNIHSKLIIADDRILRNGSSNLNNRSMGLDTECDVAFEASSAEKRRAIGFLRDCLLAEHLGTSPRRVAAAIAETGSLVRAIESLNTGRRCLRPVPIDPDSGATEPITGTAILDPDEPIDLAYLRQRFLPR